MKAVLLSVHLPDGRSVLEPEVFPGEWIRFDYEQIVAAKGEDAARVATIADMLGLKNTTLDEDIEREHLALVIQKGRLFQQMHPGAEILVDHGRFLLARLDEELKIQLKGLKAHEYEVRPAPWGETVYETREPPSHGGEQQQVVLEVLQFLSKPSLRANLERLTGYPTRHSLSQGFKDASTWCQDSLKSMGYDVERPQPITVFARPSSNVIATKPSSVDARQGSIMVVAHLDSIGGNKIDDPAPGADDNASGAAGLLLIADCLKSYRNRHELRFILFGGEEQGLRGSNLYLGKLEQEEKDQIKAVVNMDMIASKNIDPHTVALEGTTALADDIESAAGRYTNLQVQRVSGTCNGCSDHKPFFNAGIPAVLTIEGTRSANCLIHCPNDTLDTLDLDLALGIIKMNLASIVELDQRSLDYISLTTEF